MTENDVPAKDAAEKVVDHPTKMASDSSLAAGIKQAAAEVKAAFGSPHPEPVPEPPAEAASPDINPAKQLSFNVNPPSPVTPKPVVVSAGDEVLDYNTFISETLLWTNKVRSSFYFIAGGLGWLVVRAMFSSTTTAFTGLCYTLLFSLMLNFIRGIFAPKYQAQCTWSNSAIIRLPGSIMETTVSAAAALHDSHLNGLDPLKTLEVGLGLWLGSVLGRALDAITLLLLLQLGAFSLPLLYHKNKARINSTVADAMSVIKAHYDKFDRRIRATIVFVPLMLLFFVLPSLDRIVAMFIFLAYARVWVKPEEYAALQRRIEPVGRSIKKAVLTPMTAAATQAMVKYDITPTPNKRKTT